MRSSSPLFLILGLGANGDLPIAFGNISEIFRRLYRGKFAVISRRRFSARDDLEVIKRGLQRKVDIWAPLIHKNIVPFLGDFVINDSIPPCMVSLWMENGTVTQYVRTNSGVNRLQLVIEMCEGLQHLHSLDIVHGELKGGHVLISASGHVRISGFSFAIIRRELEPVDTAATDSYPSTSWRWLAQELLFPETVVASSWGPSKFSDMYALGMTILEIFSGKPPFAGITGIAAVSRVEKGIKPIRPDEATVLGMSDAIYGLIEACWDQERSNRPAISFFLERVRCETVS